MDKFQDVYRDAAEALPEFHIDTDTVKDEIHHYRMRRQRRNYILARGCTAASIFLLFGVGTAAANSYRNSIIHVNDTGVTITAQQEQEEGFPDFLSVFEQIGGVFSTADAGPDDELTEVQEMEMTEYDSLKDFLAAEKVAVALPDMTLFGEGFLMEKVCIVGNGMDVSVHLYDEERSFLMTQFDNSGMESYSTAMSFGGRSANERSFTNRQGMNYVIFDTLGEKGEVISVCAVISVNGRDLTLTFRGFDQNTMEKIINSIDLSIYFEE